MESRQKWDIVHQWRRQVARGIAEPAFCEFGHIPEEMLPAVDEDGDPVLRCIKCKTVLILGLNDLERMAQWNS